MLKNTHTQKHVQKTRLFSLRRSRQRRKRGDQSFRRRLHPPRQRAALAIILGLAGHAAGDCVDQDGGSAIACIHSDGRAFNVITTFPLHHHPRPPKLGRQHRRQQPRVRRHHRVRVAGRQGGPTLRLRGRDGGGFTARREGGCDDSVRDRVGAAAAVPLQHELGGASRAADRVVGDGDGARDDEGVAARARDGRGGV